MTIPRFLTTESGVVFCNRDKTHSEDASLLVAKKNTEQEAVKWINEKVVV
jgi:hypothetical protein